VEVAGRQAAGMISDSRQRLAFLPPALATYLARGDLKKLNSRCLINEEHFPDIFFANLSILTLLS